MAHFACVAETFALLTVRASHRLAPIFLTVHTDPDYVQEALELEAVGYIFKSRLVSDLQLAIGEVLEDRTYVSSSP